MTIPYNCSLTDFMSKIDDFSGYEEYGTIQGQRWIFDEYGSNLTESGN